MGDATEMSRISVIVPVYNVAKDLPRCLDSILRQSHEDIEIITVNDGSTDGSSDILDQYGRNHANIKVIHKENGGVTSARLCGIKAATGDWIGFVDGDDEIEPDMYERLLENAEQYQAEISHCGYRMVFEDGRVHYFHNSGILFCRDREKGIKDLLSGEVVEPGLCNKLFRRELFQPLLEGDCMDSSIRINEDLLMNYYLFQQAEKTVFQDFCPYRYIVRQSSASRQKLNEHKIYDPIRVKEIIRSQCAPGVREAAERAYLNTCINTYHSLLMAGDSDKEDRKNVRALLQKEKARFETLDKKRKLMAQLICGVPGLYDCIYRFYGRFLQKSVYS